MSKGVPFFTSSAGIARTWEEDGEDVHVHAFQDCGDTLDANRAMANENDGWSMGGGKLMRRAASIPMIVWFKWLNEEGWDAFAPENSERLKRKLNDSEWAYLRTAHWRL